MQPVRLCCMERDLIRSGRKARCSVEADGKSLRGRNVGVQRPHLVSSGQRIDCSSHSSNYAPSIHQSLHRIQYLCIIAYTAVLHPSHYPQQLRRKHNVGPAQASPPDPFGLCTIPQTRQPPRNDLAYHSSHTTRIHAQAVCRKHGPPTVIRSPVDPRRAGNRRSQVSRE
jgi:hypothetical protein